MFIEEYKDSEKSNALSHLSFCKPVVSELYAGCRDFEMAAVHVMCSTSFLF
jgi:hypothetical protein